MGGNRAFNLGWWQRSLQRGSFRTRYECELRQAGLILAVIFDLLSCFPTGAGGTGRLGTRLRRIGTGRSRNARWHALKVFNSSGLAGCGLALWALATCWTG